MASQDARLTLLGIIHSFPNRYTGMLTEVNDIVLIKTKKNWSEEVGANE